jgi:peptidoglycan/LPS O-acetylase OafA/YrhL
VVRVVAAWVARYSYGIYLSHVVIFWIVLVVLRNSPLLVKIGVCAVLSVVVPVVLYHTIEKPMINVGVRVANSMALWLATLASRPVLAGASDSLPEPDVDFPASPAP